MDSIRALLHQIAVHHDYTLLETLRDASVWREWPQEARHALALLFAEYAASRLSGTHLEETFTLAESLAPDCPLLATRRAMMLSLRHTDVQALKRAHHAFQQARERDPEGFLTSWEAWGDTLRHLALLQKDVDYAQEALVYYEKAHQTTDHKEHLSRIYYHMAQCYHLLGECSEEAAEVSKALELLEHARRVDGHSLAIQLLEVQSFSTLSRFLDRPDLAETALQQVITIFSSNHAALSNQQRLLCHRLVATLAATLYRYSYETTLFSLAYEHFDSALRHLPTCAALHLECAQFLTFAGKLCREIAVIQEALMHFAKSGINLEQGSDFLGEWAEAELLLASCTEDLQLIRAAEKKIICCMQAQPKLSSAICLHTQLLIEQGRYFSDTTYYETALLILKEALDQTPNHPGLWLNLATAHLGLGELTRKVLSLQKAVHAYNMVVECGGEETLHLYTDWAATLLQIGERNEDSSFIEKAVKVFETAIALGDQMQLGGATPTQPYLDCLYSYGCALDCLGDCSQEIAHYEKAIQTLSTVLIASPDHPYARYNLAVSLSHLGEVTQDIEPLRKSLELFTLLTHEDPEDDASWQEWGVCLMHLAQLLQDPGRPEEAQTILEDAETKLLRAASLGNPRAYYYLACVHSLFQSSEMGLYYLSKAIQEKCLPTVQLLVEEEWLNHLRTEPKFHLLLEQLSLDKQKESET